MAGLGRDRVATVNDYLSAKEQVVSAGLSSTVCNEPISGLLDGRGQKRTPLAGKGESQKLLETFVGVSPPEGWDKSWGTYPGMSIVELTGGGQDRSNASSITTSNTASPTRSSLVRLASFPIARATNPTGQDRVLQVQQGAKETHPPEPANPVRRNTPHTVVASFVVV